MSQTSKHRVVMLGIAAGAVMLALGGCSSLYQPPQAWQKGLLAKEAMTMGGDAQEQRFNQHINTSKEAASGGGGVGGGGCGCN